MHSTLNEWLTELEDEIELITSDDINVEANSNMVTFGVNESIFKDWGESSVIAFLSGCADLYQAKSQGINMVFYSWYDDMSGQLRISAVSQKHESLPFRCKLNTVCLDKLVGGICSETDNEGNLDVWRRSI